MQNQSINVQYANQVKVLKLDPFMLYVRVTTRDTHPQTLNCIVVQHALTLFYQLQPDARLALYGHYNQRHQFVITKFMVSAPVQSLAS
ncbi:hypothetical protein [Lactiplantibacillus carotarum]|uniref:hypothetical protein n=1 Tax=Lactiplantibacillus carotarum TaxID=2993456 RepID=UPI00298F13E8|nr:hypothetical protein [Lactiplantibacillus carotarum]